MRKIEEIKDGKDKRLKSLLCNLLYSFVIYYII